MNCCGTFNARRAEIFQSATTPMTSDPGTSTSARWTCSECGGQAVKPCPCCFTTLCWGCARRTSHAIAAGKHAGQRCLGQYEPDRGSDARLQLEAKLATKQAKPWNLTGFVKVERSGKQAAE